MTQDSQSESSEAVNLIEKSGHSPQQLNKIALLEKHRDGLKNELAKKSYNHDIVQQGFDKEKRKVGSSVILFYLSYILD